MHVLQWSSRLWDKSRVLLTHTHTHTHPVGFSVHWWADEGAREEGHRQFEAWHWEVKQRWGGCWRAGWLHPPAVHFPEPKRRHRSAHAAFLSSMVMGSSFTTMFTCQKCFLVSCEAIKYLAWFPHFKQTTQFKITPKRLCKRVFVQRADAKEKVFVLRSKKGQSRLFPEFMTWRGRDHEISWTSWLSARPRWMTGLWMNENLHGHIYCGFIWQSLLSARFYVPHSPHTLLVLIRANIDLTNVVRLSRLLIMPPPHYPDRSTTGWCLIIKNR